MVIIRKKIVLPTTFIQIYHVGDKGLTLIFFFSFFYICLFFSKPTLAYIFYSFILFFFAFRHSIHSIFGFLVKHSKLSPLDYILYWFLLPWRETCSDKWKPKHSYIESEFSLSLARTHTHYYIFISVGLNNVFVCMYIYMCLLMCVCVCVWGGWINMLAVLTRQPY